MSMKREENFHARKIPVPWLAMSDEVWAISLMTTNVGFNGGVTIGCVLRTIDVSPNHAGIVMGFVNTLANVVSLLTSLVAGSMVTDAVCPSSVSFSSFYKLFLIIVNHTYSTIARSGKSYS